MGEVIASAQILLMWGSDLPIVFLVFAAAIGIRWATDRVDRQRIRQHVEESGGTVLDIVTESPWGWRWNWSRDRTYQVTYRTNHGKVITATCGTSMSSGVYWRRYAPPGIDLRESQTEPIDCLECGAKIPARQARCPKCGWGYTGK